MATPTAEESDLVLYQTASNELLIDGTGFMGSKKIDLFFKPPLYVEVGYEIISRFPLTKDQLVLRLRHGYKWRETPGPLLLVGIDSGGGPIKLNVGEGIQVADVQPDLDAHSVTVLATATEQLIYNDEPKVFVKGTGFNPQGNTLRFSNGLLGKAVNYAVKDNTPNRLTLSLVPTSHWRQDGDNLPGYLTLLAVNAGDGFVAVGPMNSGKGVDIATVFERPSVYSSNVSISDLYLIIPLLTLTTMPMQVKLYRTHSRELHLSGVGFTRSLGKTGLIFEPPFTEGTDYSLLVVTRTALEITLLDGKRYESYVSPFLYYIALSPNMSFDFSLA